jgi:hypothetical protein
MIMNRLWRGRLDTTVVSSYCPLAVDRSHLCEKLESMHWGSNDEKLTCYHQSYVIKSICSLFVVFSRRALRMAKEDMANAAFFPFSNQLRESNVGRSLEP